MSNFYAEGEYAGPERRVNPIPRRKMVLTRGDILAIAAEMKKHHVCRYDIPPADMKALLDFVRMFRDGAVETGRATRSFIIKKVMPKMIVAALLAFIADMFGVLRPLVNGFLRAFRGG
jgi:hypothetical protein